MRAPTLKNIKSRFAATVTWLWGRGHMFQLLFSQFLRRFFFRAPFEHFVAFVIFVGAKALEEGVSDTSKNSLGRQMMMSWWNFGVLQQLDQQSFIKSRENWSCYIHCAHVMDSQKNFFVEAKDSPKLFGTIILMKNVFMWTFDSDTLYLTASAWWFHYNWSE